MGDVAYRWLDVNRDIVDTTPADGNVLKMLLGATNNWYDGAGNSFSAS